MANRYAPYVVPSRPNNGAAADAGAGGDVVLPTVSGDNNNDDSKNGAGDAGGDGVSWLDLRHGANRAAHRTSDYESPSDAVDALFARRGNEWRFRVSAEAFVSSVPDVEISTWVTLSSGQNPSQVRGSWIQLEAEKEDAEEERRLEEEEDDVWRLIRRTSTSTTASSAVDQRWIDFRLRIPVEASVSRYDIDFEVWLFDPSRGSISADESWSLVLPKFSTRCYVLFNPWCRRDDVFLDDADAADVNDDYRDEYVLNDVGRVFVGSADRPRGRKWNFGQFEAECVEAAFEIVERIDDFDGRGDAVNVMRTISQILNAMDEDGGVLEGNWSGDYSGGRAPWSWNGSRAILSQWLRTRSPVRYGQCWVFSALATTVCRALGIPARSVTNFQSGHDTNANLVLEFYVNADGADENRADDSKWNFHVWNEGWSRRRDLASAASSSGGRGVYDGWQAFDATPQEESRGLMRCGPAPVKAVKEGDVGVPFDAKFIFAEVNGTVIHYLCKCSFKRSRHWGKHDIVRVDSRGVGRSISTKAVGRRNESRADVTHLYKHPEGSEDERMALKRAHPRTNRHVKKLIAFLADKRERMSCSFVVSPPDCVARVGDVVSATLCVESRSDEDLEIERIVVSVGAYTYSGRPLAYVFKSLFPEDATTRIPAGERKSFRLVVDESEYLRFVDRDAFLHFRCVVKPIGAKPEEVFVDRKIVDLNLPEVLMEVMSSSRSAGEDTIDSAVTSTELPVYRIRLVFENPLDEPLDNCIFHVEGANMPPVETTPTTCGAKQPVEAIVEIRPKLRGAREIFASFTSNLISSVVASAFIDV